MEFLTGATASGKQQLLAIGDVVGSLHVFQVPRNLMKGGSNERNTIDNFFNREINRMATSESRMNARVEEYDAKKKEEGEEEEEEDGMGGGGGGGGGAGEGMGGGEEGGGDGEWGEVALVEEENAYKELEAKFIEQLQLTADDLPEGFDMSRVVGEED